MKLSIDRFMEKVSPEALTGCWLWTGAVDQNGYGCMTVNHENIRAHRFAMREIAGNLIEGLDVCHHCDTPSCVNPGHLFVGLAVDNVRDMFAKGRNPTRTRAECRRGHQLSGDNLYRWKNVNHCRACTNLRARQYTAAKEKPERAISMFCGKGHEFTESNTYMPPKGSRQCVECRRLAGQRHDQKRRNSAQPKEMK